MILYMLLAEVTVTATLCFLEMRKISKINQTLLALTNSSFFFFTHLFPQRSAGNNKQYACVHVSLPGLTVVTDGI